MYLFPVLPLLLPAHTPSLLIPFAPARTTVRRSRSPFPRSPPSHTTSLSRPPSPASGRSSPVAHNSQTQAQWRRRPTWLSLARDYRSPSWTARGASPDDEDRPVQLVPG